MINGSPKKKPIAKWPGVELGCSRLEAVSTLAHHTVTQNTSNYNARALGPALNTNLKPRARQGSANDPQSIAARVRPLNFSWAPGDHVVHGFVTPVSL
jgi:hypothetical protein